MEVSGINSQDVIFSLDIGTRSVIATVGILKDKKLHIVAESYREHSDRAMIDGQIHDINRVAETVNTVKREIESNLGFQLKDVAIAAAGRFLKTVVAKSNMDIDYDKEIDKETIRSLELTAVKQAEEAISSEAQGKLYCVGYSVKNYYLNGYVISNPLFHKGETMEAEIIATFLPRYVVESLYSVMDKVGLNVISLTLEPIAAMEAAIPSNLRMLNLALVDIGAGTSDIAISSKDSISAYGMVSIAGDEVTEAIAHTYLVDFNTAEIMKRKCDKESIITFVDVMGLENQVSKEEILTVIDPVVNRISEEIAHKIIELNGNKSPNAVFLVGGGAHTPGLKEKLAKLLNIAPQRVGIKGREAVTDCVCSDMKLGSAGVTVLGIALVSIKQLGHDFIDVVLNGTVISMFNSHRHTVMDVMLQGGINPKLLIGKNGKNIKFNFNGMKRIAFGTLASNAEITINGEKKGIDSEVREGDNIDIEFAKDGKDAEAKVMEFIRNLFSITFYVNELYEVLEPLAFSNGEKVSMDYLIKEGDTIEIIYPETLGDYKKYYTDNQEASYMLGNVILEDDYIIKEGDRIYRKEISLNREILESENKEEAALFSDIEEKKNEESNVESNKDRSSENKKEDNGITVIVNERPIHLKNKSQYIFVDIFNYVEFDLSMPKGSLMLLLNDKKAGYYDILSDGDIIKIFWEKN